MKNKHKVIKIIYFIILAVIIFGYKDLSKLTTDVCSNSNDLHFVSCGSAKEIPRPIPQLTTVAYTLLVTATPLILIIFSIITMVKATATGSADDIEKAKKNLFKKFIIAGIIFFVSAIVQFILLKVTTNKNDSKSVTNCLKCFMYYSKDNCPTYCEDGKTYNDRYKSKPTSNYSSNKTHTSSVNSNNTNSSNRTTSNSSSNNSSNVNLNNKVIFVGDSRTNGMCGFNDYNMHSGDSCRDYVAVSQAGMGATWFKNNAISAVNSILNQNSSSSYKILILLGVNDVGENAGDETANLNVYKELLVQMANEDWKKHNIVFVKVTTGDRSLANQNNMHVSQEQIDSFNRQMKEFITSKNLSNLHFCDINDVSKSYLVDGVHYTFEGSEFLYLELKNKCI